MLKEPISLRELLENQDFKELNRIRAEAVKNGFSSDSKFIGWDEETPYLIEKYGFDEILGRNEFLLEQLETFLNL